jgi:hypothetical protein
MTVEVRRADKDEWLLVVHGEPIGSATTEEEARELAEYWEGMLACAAKRRLAQPSHPMSLLSMLRSLVIGA